MNIFVVLAAIVLVTYFLVQVSKNLKFPSVVALILSGLLWNIPLLDGLIAEVNHGLIDNLGELGLIALMFLAGLETSTRQLKNETKSSLIISIGASVVSFLLGFVAVYLMVGNWLIAIITGICLSITAEATTAELLLEIKKIKTRVGTIMLEAGIFDDIFGLLVFIFITFIFGVFNWQTDLLLLLALLAFVAGIISQRPLKKQPHERAFLEHFLQIFLVPFFFVSMGLNFEFSSLIINPYLFIVILIVAIAGKLLGTFAVKRFVKLTWEQLHLIGWAMNSRGAIELALALIAFRAALIPQEIYSSLVVMALITTLAFPMVVYSIIKRKPRIMK